MANSLLYQNSNTMYFKRVSTLIVTHYLLLLISNVVADDILGCGGFVKSHADIDFSKVQIKLYTKAGSLKDQTECAPNNGYYFLPLYDKGEYILKVEPPRGWSFEPTEVPLNVDGTTDICSEGKDINFVFKGFGITGRVISAGTDFGPKGVSVSLYTENNKQTPVGTTITSEGGIFSFTPIQPGKYTLVASHSKWIFEKNVAEATVREGNTELPSDSLVLFGYDVTGKVTSEGEPVSGVSFLLFPLGNSSPSLKKALDCSTSPVPGFEAKKPICHVTSDSSGRFAFPAVLSGQYRLVPYFAGSQTKFEVQPPELLLRVEHDSVILSDDFKVTGFVVSGFVYTSDEKTPLSGATIYLSGKNIAVTDNYGKYTVENMKAGQYTLKAKAANVQFEEKVVRISPSSPELPALIPTSYEVCGKVTLSTKGTVHYRKVAVDNTALTFHKEVETDPNTGEFCLFLAPGKYQLSVIVSTEEKTRGLQFFPLQQTVDVTNRPIKDINFLQLKATLTGIVQCLEGSDCDRASVTLKVLDGATVKTIQTKGGAYQFTDVLPGYYEVLIDTDVFCWENPSYRVSVTSEHAIVPPFIQTGFSVTFISSHDTSVEYSDPNDSRVRTLELSKGSTRHCISKPGVYKFVPRSCHVYSKSSYTWDTNNLSPIILSSTEHTHKGYILSRTSLNNVKVKIESNGEPMTIGPLNPVKENGMYKYVFEFIANVETNYIITPISVDLLFKPSSVQVVGVNDCQNDVATFTGELGKIVKGGIQPPLEDVTVKIFGKDEETPLHEIITQADGKYKVGPLDDKINYRVTAEKEGYVITGPDSNGVFSAHKLAEILVRVSDQADNAPLQGVLLSLSGGQTYRRNSVTSENGQMTFKSLSPGEYYLRPMMKEYRFDPPSKMINVKDGESVTVQLFGKRVAFSAYGKVTSLNGEPEQGLLIEAQGQNECSNLQEEATSEENGNFRIRGLQPTCVYAIRLKANAEANAHIQRAAPDSMTVQAKEDIRGLRLTAFHPISRTDVSAHVVAVQPEHYRTLKVKLCREDTPDSPIHTAKLDNHHSGKVGTGYNTGFLIHFPPLQADGKKYFVQLESSLSQSLHKYKTVPVYFEANSSFKYIKFTFDAERKVDQSDLNQTSIVALPFIMLVALAFFNREKLWSWLNTVVEKWSKPVPISRTPVPVVPIDPRADDIIVEQIMNINKRKVKPRKV